MDSPFSMNAAISPGMADAPPSPEQNAGAAWGKAAGYMKETKDRAADAERINQTKFSMDSDGRVKVETDAETVKMFQNALKMQQQIQGIYQQKIAENEAQQAGLKAHPFANALAQIAASVGASSKDPLVRGLGDAAQRLNPTLEQLKASQMGLLKGAEGAALGQAETANRAQALAQQQQYHKDTLEAKRMDDRGRIEKDAGISARRGEFEKDSYIKELIAAGESPERATAAAERLEKVSQEAQKRNEAALAQRQKEIDAKEANFQKSLDARAANTDKLIAAAAERAEKAAARGEAKDAAKEAKKKDPSPVLKKQLADLGGADAALNEIEKILKDPENQKVMGPYAGRASELGAKVAPGLTDPQGKIKGLIGKLGLQTAQAIKATGAGARGFGPQERPYFEKLAEGIHNTAEQNLKILENWRHFLDQERKGITAANPDVDWTEKYAQALGPRMGKAAASEKKLVFNPKTGKIEEQ